MPEKKDNKLSRSREFADYSTSVKERYVEGKITRSVPIETIQEIGRNDGLRLTCTLRE